MKKIHFLVLVFLWGLFSCSTDQENAVANDLATFLQGQAFEVDNVIACAAGNENPRKVSVYVYPRPDARNIQLYLTESASVGKNDFSAYVKEESTLIDVFNGYLLRYEIEPENEKWAIITFEEGGKQHLSNPIRLKQLTKPTEYRSDNITLNLQMPLMPQFIWQDGRFDDTKIYFHVVSDAADNLFSGTYTFEKNFQYYKLNNVVLNITEEVPPALILGNSYNFTLLAVSEDNWVNLFSVLEFIP